MRYPIAPSAPSRVLSARLALIALGFPLLLLLLLCFSGACSGGGERAAPSQAPSTAPRAALVRVAPVELRQVRREIETTGFLESEHQVTVYSKVQGRVLEVIVDEGAQVKKGQVLARLDPREAEAALRQTQVLFEDRKVRLELQKLEVEASGRRIEQARTDRKRAEAEWRRNADMDPTLISPKIVEDSRFAFDNADEALRVAEFSQKKAVLDVKAAENLILELEAKLEDSKIKLAEHEAVAPFDGMVTARRIRGGETIGPQTDLFVVTDLENLIGYLSRPQRELPLAQNSKEVAFTADGYPGQEFVADIDLVSRVIDQTTGSFKLRLRARRDDTRALRPGMFIRARILTEQMREALMVPKHAVLTDGELAVVFTVRNGQARKVTLDPGLEQKTYVECRNRGDDGLLPTDVVIVSGHQDIKDQVPVTVQQDAPRDAPGNAPSNGAAVSDPSAPNHSAPSSRTGSRNTGSGSQGAAK